MPTVSVDGMSHGTKVLPGPAQAASQDVDEVGWSQFSAGSTIRFPHPGEVEPFARSDMAMPGLAVPGMGGLRELGGATRTLAGVGVGDAEPMPGTAPDASDAPVAADVPRPLAAGVPDAPEAAPSHGRRLADEPAAGPWPPVPNVPQPGL